MISQEEFLALPTEQVAELVRQSGSAVCVFPINGTRRWFMLEYGNHNFDDPIAAYMDISGRNHIDLYKLFFNHGIDTLLAPVFGSELLTRGDDYMARIGADGMARLASHPDFIHFYKNYDVRVGFYGDHRKHLATTPYAYLSDLFKQVTAETKAHERYRLFFGVFANDATESVAELSIGYFEKNRCVPSRHDIIEMYYGEYIAPVNIFIGFDKFSVFDYPLLNLGEENLYFTAVPSPYITARQLRHILYDHLFTRRSPEPDYNQLSSEEIAEIRAYYTANQEQIFGTGILNNGLWQPDITTKR